MPPKNKNATIKKDSTGTAGSPRNASRSGSAVGRQQQIPGGTPPSPQMATHDHVALEIQKVLRDIDQTYGAKLSHVPTFWQLVSTIGGGGFLVVVATLGGLWLMVTTLTGQTERAFNDVGSLTQRLSVAEQQIIQIQSTQSDQKEQQNRIISLLEEMRDRQIEQAQNKAQSDADNPPPKGN